jgi:hypothetical protein
MTKSTTPSTLGVSNFILLLTEKLKKSSPYLSLIVLLLIGASLSAQTNGQIYPKYLMGSTMGDNHYHPNYLGGVNANNPECFDYSMGDNSSPDYEMRNSTISLNRRRNQINTSSNVFRLSTGHQKIKFVETDINMQAFRKAEFSYKDPALCWFHSSHDRHEYNYMSGAILNSQTFPHPIFPTSSIYTTGQGMIKKFDLNSGLNADIYTRYMGSFNNIKTYNTTRFQDVIVKVIEHGEFIYAVGYCALDPGYGRGTGLIYKIPVKYFNASNTCNSSTCPDIELFTYGNFISDIMEINGEIYFVGSTVRLGVGTFCLIGNLNRNYVREDVNIDCTTGVHGEPFFASMNYNPNTQLIECLAVDHHNAFSGIIPYDLNLNQSGSYTNFDMFSLNLNNANPKYNNLGPALPVPMYFKDLEYDQNYNIILSGYAMLGSEVHRVNLAYDRTQNIINGSMYRPPINIRTAPVLINPPISNPAPMQEMIAYDPRGRAPQGFLYSTENYNFSQDAIANVKRMDYDRLLTGVDMSCTGCHEIPLSFPVRTECVDLHHEEKLEKGEFEIETNPKVQGIKIQEDYPMHCDDAVENNISGCPYWESDIVYTNITTPKNTSTALCQGDEIRLGAMQKNYFGTSTLKWFRNGIQFDADRLTIRTFLTGTYHFEATRNQHDGTTCTFISNPLIITETRSNIIATPDSFICQGQSTTLSISHPQPASYKWMKFYSYTSIVYDAQNVQTTPTISVNFPTKYGVELVHANTCKELVFIDVLRRGIVVSQAITETGSAMENLDIAVCNFDPTPMTNVQINTDLVSGLITNPSPNTGGWTLTGNTHRFTIPSLPAGSPTNPSCTTIRLPVRVNKCSTTLQILTIYPGVCSPNFSTQTYWPANNFTASITNTTGVSCNAAPLTLNGSPATGGYTYEWWRNSTPLVATTASLVAATSARYDFLATRNQCTQRAFIDVTINPTVTFTATTTIPPCGSIGNITVTAAGGTPPYTYSSNNGGVYQSSNVFSLNGGTYSVIVRDALGCTSAAQSVTVSPINNTISFTESIIPKSCNTNGSISLTSPTTTGTCTGPFTYKWSTGAITPFISGLNAGNYFVTVTDCNGCTKVKTLTVPNIINTVNFSETITPKTCTTNGSISITNPTTTGTCGAGTFTYLWSTGATTSSIPNLSAGNYSVTVKDCNGCTKVKTLIVGLATNTIGFTETISPQTCSGGGIIAITNPTTTGTCGAGTYTYLWSTGATSPTITNLAGGSYTVTVTDCNGCTKAMTYTVPNLNSIVQAEVVQSLMNCALPEVRYTVYPTAGTAPYTYIWYRAGIQIATTPTLTTTNQQNLSVRITDANGYCKLKIIDAAINNPTPYYIGSARVSPIESKMSTSTMPAIVNNARIFIKGNFDIDVVATWNHCDVIFESPNTASSISSISVSLPSTQTTFSATNTHFHTCNAEMQKGFVVNGTSKVVLNNCLVQDMYTAFQVIANGDLRLNNNTSLENNFIGIKHFNHSVLNYSLNSTWFTIKGGPTKLVSPNRYTNTNLAFTTLEPGSGTSGMSSTALTKSYAGIIAENTQQIIMGQSSQQILISDLPNGILLKNSTHIIDGFEFKNITDAANTYGNAACTNCKTKYTIYGYANSSFYEIIYNGRTRGVVNIENADRGIYTYNYGVQVTDFNTTNIQNTAIDATGLAGNFNHTLSVRYSNIKAKKAVQAYMMRTNTLENNAFEDLGSVATLEPIVDLKCFAGLIQSATATVTNNTFRINKSRYGLALLDFKKTTNSTTNDVLVNNNTFTIFNTGTGTNGTYAGTLLNNLRNVSITGNKYSLSSTSNFTAPMISPSLANTAPMGMLLTTVENGLMSCNDFYTRAGVCFYNTASTDHFNGLLIKTNNFLTSHYGLLFNNYNNTTAIPTNSNKFYCGSCSNSVAYKITGTNPNLAAQNSTQRLSSTTICPIISIPICNTPTPLPFVFFDNTRMNFTLAATTTSTTGDMGCITNCTPDAPPVPIAPPMFKLAAQTPTQSSAQEAIDCDIYPNPAQDRFSIALRGLETTPDMLQVEMVDMQGRVVYTQRFISPTDNRVEVSHTAISGSYLVRVSDGNGLKLIKRLQVQHNDLQLIK